MTEKPVLLVYGGNGPTEHRPHENGTLRLACDPSRSAQMAIKELEAPCLHQACFGSGGE